MHQKIMTMHDDQETMADLYATLGRDALTMQLMWKLLGFIGHIPRRPEYHSEKRALRCALMSEANTHTIPGKQNASKPRAQAKDNRL